MYEVEIDRRKCRRCGACTKASQTLFLDEENLINMEGAYVEEDTVEGFVKTLYEIETPASICPEDCFTVYDDETGEKIEIERRSTI